MSLCLVPRRPGGIKETHQGAYLTCSLTRPASVDFPSLNVANAFAIAAYSEAVRQRTGKRAHRARARKIPFLRGVRRHLPQHFLYFFTFPRDTGRPAILSTLESSRVASSPRFMKMTGASARNRGLHFRPAASLISRLLCPGCTLLSMSRKKVLRVFLDIPLRGSFLGRIPLDPPQGGHWAQGIWPERPLKGISEGELRAFSRHAR